MWDRNGNCGNGEWEIGLGVRMGIGVANWEWKSKIGKREWELGIVGTRKVTKIKTHFLGLWMAICIMPYLYQQPLHRYAGSFGRMRKYDVRENLWCAGSRSACERFTLFSMINLGSCSQPHPIRIQALTLFLSLAWYSKPSRTYILERNGWLILGAYGDTRIIY